MPHFLDANFLLSNPHAERLYHEYASGLPIIDYHGHLPPQEIAENINFDNLTAIWLKGDHYKWRAMRALGISEEYITGSASDQEKFRKWAECVPKTIRNPLFHWTHLELQRYFQISDLLNTKSADYVYNVANEKLRDPDYSTHSILDKMNVEVVCTTDDPLDDLSFHRGFGKKKHNIKMLPTFRPDQVLAFGIDSYNDYLVQLSQLTDTEINSLEHLMVALNKRIDYFHEHGCRLADHGLNQLSARSSNYELANQSFVKKINGQLISEEEMGTIQAYVMEQLGSMYHQKGWVMQLHLGAIRNTRSRMLGTLGKDAGFDSIGDYSQVRGLQRLLDGLDSQSRLPKTIVYNLNPSDNEAICTMVANFNQGPDKGKMQYGSAWWFLDQKDGIVDQLNTLSNMGILSTFIGMLTDSRSFMSFPRHEYFRRILCDVLGRDMAAGLCPVDYKWIGGIVCDICYHNARGYFNFS